jgi:hypothetical protein
MTIDQAQEIYDNQLPKEDDEELVECCRCETQELAENMLNTDMGYLCECCEGDLC